jgi:amino acid transporter
LWVKEGLPGPNAFLAGWMSWFAHAVAGSLYALGFGSYVFLMLQVIFAGTGPVSILGLDEVIIHKALAALIVLLFVYINYRGSSETGLAGNIVTVLKVVILAIFIASGLWTVAQNPSYFQKFENFAPEGFAGVITAMGLTFIAFEGYEIIVQAGEEVKDPRRTIPKAVFLSLAIVIPIYMLVAFVSLGAVNPETSQATYEWLAQHAELGVAEAARQFMPYGTVLLLVGGILSTMSALNATTFSSTRVSFAMGRDRNLPDSFGEIHTRTRTPHRALMWSGVLILFMAVAIPLEDVAAAADIMFLLLFLQVNVAVITIRRKYGDRLNYGYLLPFFPIVPIVAIVALLFLADRHRGAHDVATGRSGPAQSPGAHRQPRVAARLAGAGTQCRPPARRRHFHLACDQGAAAAAAFGRARIHRAKQGADGPGFGPDGRTRRAGGGRDPRLP